MPDRTSLAIVIVSYNVRAELDGCLQSIVAQTPTLETEIVVVDNGSTDGTPAMVRERWPRVRVLEPGGNLGFARGNNVGIRDTTSEMVLLLNPDTIVRPGAIETLVAALNADASAAVAGPRLVDQDGAPEISFGSAISPLGEFRQKLVAGLYQRRMRAVVDWVERRTREGGTRDWVSGACLLVRRRDLETVGLVDERYFMYTEDVDLCVSLGAHGRRTLFVPSAEVVHLRGRSAGRNPDTERLRRRSQLAYYAKHHPAWVPVLKLYLRLTGKGAALSDAP